MTRDLHPKFLLRKNEKYHVNKTLTAKYISFMNRAISCSPTEESHPGIRCRPTIGLQQRVEKKSCTVQSRLTTSELACNFRKGEYFGQLVLASMERWFVILALVCVIPCYSWGPVTHSLTAQKALHLTTPSLQWGTYLPDSFYFGNLLLGSKCLGLQSMHDLTFAGNLELILVSTFRLPSAPQYDVEESPFKL